MSRPANTLSDLLATTSTTATHSFYCPKCGSQMSFLLPYSVVPIFSPDALERVNQYFVGFYRNWVFAIAGFLNRVNIGVKDRDAIVDSLLKDDHAKELLSLVAPVESLDSHSINRFKAQGVLRAGPISEDFQRLQAALDDRSLGQQIQDRVPPVVELLGESAGSPEALDGLKALIECVLWQIEAGDLFAVLTDIVLSQREVEEWVEATKRAPRGETGGVPLETFVESLKTLCVDQKHQHYEYLWKYLEVLATQIGNRDEWNRFAEQSGIVVDGGDSDPEGVDEWRRVKNRFERACVIIALLTMHHTRKGQKTLDRHFPSRFGDRGGNHYQLPKLATLTYKHMFDFLLAAEVVRFNWLGVQSKYASLLARIGEEVGEHPNDAQAHKVFVAGLEDDEFRSLMHDCFGFACLGPGAAALTFSETGGARNGDRNTLTQDVLRDPFCGWYPKSYPTYSVVLLGTPGSGKSAAFQSGCAMLSWMRNGIRDYSFLPDDSRTHNQITRLQELFSRQAKPPRTSRSDYYALTMKLSRQKDEAEADEVDAIGFVFVDIPGERSTLELREDRADPLVFNTLSHADIVVVFLDLNTDCDFGPKFINGPHAQQFRRFRTSRHDAQTDRPLHGHDDGADVQEVEGPEEQMPKEANEPNPEQRPIRAGDERPVNEGGNAEGREETLANCDQFGFVMWAANKIEELRHGDRNPFFLVVVPKADLYIDQDAQLSSSSVQSHQATEQEKHFFLHGFFAELLQQSVLSYPDRQQFGFAELYSTGATTWRAPDEVARNHTSLEQWVRTFEGQYELMKRMSIKFLSASEQLGAVVSTNPDVNPIARLWSGAFSTLQERLTSYFGDEDVLFLPMSAQGFERDPDRDMNEGADGAHDQRDAGGFPQKLCEFLFVAPMILAALKGNDRD